MDQTGSDDHRALTERRGFLKRAAIGAAAAWVAPTVLSQAAHAQGSGAPLLRVIVALGGSVPTCGGILSLTPIAGVPTPPADAVGLLAVAGLPPAVALEIHHLVPVGGDGDESVTLPPQPMDPPHVMGPPLPFEVDFGGGALPTGLEVTYRCIAV